MALGDLYVQVKAGRANLKSPQTRANLQELIGASLASLVGAETVPLTSNVPGKSYAMLRRGALTTRPFNVALFKPDTPLSDLLGAFLDYHPGQNADLDEALYTAAMSFPIARDLERAGDKKSPGTFFEIFIGHIVASRFDINPITSITAPTLDTTLTIPTDYIYEIGQDRRIHLPVKLSTRERVVQVWAHQKLLDGMHGVGRFKGVLVCGNETNKQQETSVVEVCLPNQWAAYQMYIARMERVYYLDPPATYLALRNSFPHLQVWPFSKFFSEAEALVSLS